jgi:hypothetical protein
MLGMEGAVTLENSSDLSLHSTYMMSRPLGRSRYSIRITEKSKGPMGGAGYLTPYIQRHGVTGAKWAQGLIA